MHEVVASGPLFSDLREFYYLEIQILKSARVTQELIEQRVAGEVASHAAISSPGLISEPFVHARLEPWSRELRSGSLCL